MKNKNDVLINEFNQNFGTFKCSIGNRFGARGSPWLNGFDPGTLENKVEQIHIIVKAVRETVKRLRELSPL